MRDKMMSVSLSLESRAIEARGEKVFDEAADAYEQAAQEIRDAIDGPFESIRCSRLPLALACPGSLIGDWSAEGDDYAARLGSAVHHVLADHLCRRGWDTDATAVAFSVDPAELESLVFQAVKLWDGLRSLFPDAQAEKEMGYGDSRLMLTGTADVVHYDPDSREVRVLDWKTGREDADHEEQLKGYCWLAINIYPEADVARGCVVRIRDGLADWTCYTREALAAWWETVTERLKNLCVYRPGPHCTRCPHARGCHANRDTIRQAAQVLMDQPRYNLPATELGNLYDRVRIVEVLCEQARNAIKAEVAARGGRIDLGNGRTLEIAESVTRKVDYAAGREVVAEALSDLSDDWFYRILTVNKSALDKAIMETAPRGQKTARLNEVYSRLEAAGAIQTTTTQRLEVRRNGNHDADAQRLGDADQPAITHRASENGTGGANGLH